MRSTRGLTRAMRAASAPHYTSAARVTAPRRSTERARYGVMPSIVAGVTATDTTRVARPKLNTMANRRNGGGSMYYVPREGWGQ